MTTRIHAPQQPAGRPMRPSRHANTDPLALLGNSGRDDLDVFGPESVPQDQRKPLPAAKADSGDAFEDTLDAAFGAES